MNEELLERYLTGKLKINIDGLSNEDKIKWARTEELLDSILKELNQFFYHFDQIKKAKELWVEHNAPNDR